MSAPAPEGTPAAATGAQAAPEGQAPTPAEQAPDPKETVEHWKSMARKSEERAKANAEAAKRLAEIEDQAKTAEQKAAEKAEQIERELAETRAANVRYKAAAVHGISEENFDLLGEGSEEEVLLRAERIGEFEDAVRELDELREKNKQLEEKIQQLTGSGPVPALSPGNPVPDDHAYNPSWFPQLRASSVNTNT